MTSRISKIARKSVVIIVDERDPEVWYCSGSVVSKDGSNSVMVITNYRFVKGRERFLKVVFSDGEELKPVYAGRDGMFCFLKTEFHSGCRPMNILEEDSDSLVPSKTFLFGPISPKFNLKMQGYCNLECLGSYYSLDESVFVSDSAKYCLVNCPYSETLGKRGKKRINKLTGAQVFSPEGKTLGLVVQDCREKEACAAGIKVVLKASYIPELKPPPEAPAKKRAKKRKRV